jgi:hypothetical protein
VVDSVHTLVLVDDSEILFIVQGALEYLGSSGETLAHEDWRSITDKYVDLPPGRARATQSQASRTSTS